MSAITRSAARNPGFRLTKQERALREESPPRPWRSVAQLPIALGVRVAIVIAVVQPYAVWADVWPQASSGVPQQVIPQYQEVGAPTFVMPQGSQTATPQGAAAGSQDPGTTAGLASSPGFVASTRPLAMNGRTWFWPPLARAWPPPGRAVPPGANAGQCR